MTRIMNAGDRSFENEASRLFGEGQPAPREDFTVAVINYPGYHPTPLMEAWYGFGWSEWDLVRRCRPRFKGHRQPLECLWGEYNEADPQWAAKETDAAADHGIDVWIYDWYWYSGIEIWNEALNDGFLKAHNRQRMKFAVMWANHTWTNNHPAPLSGPLPALLPIRHSLENLDRIVDYWSQRYFTQPSYWRVDGKPWCSFFLLSNLLEQLGGERGVGKAVERVRRRAEANGEADICLCLFTRSTQEAELAARLGFDQVTTYNLVQGSKQRPGQALVDYSDVMVEHMRHWQTMNESPVPYLPVVTHGWDVSARNHPYEPWPPVRWEWPWGHIVTGNTPRRFGQLVSAARQMLATQNHPHKTMIINAWNEWTEGAVLLPTRDEKWGVLKALKSALE